MGFKKLFPTKNLCWGIPLEKAARYVGIADLTLGMMFFSILFLHLNEVKYKVPEEKQTLRNVLAFLPRWLSEAILISHVVKFSMGILIYLGAVVKSPGICRFWLLVSGIGSIFAFPTNLVHIFGLLVVYQFWQELCDEARGPKGAQHRLSRGHSICPEGIDVYLPKCENNNELDGKYIGFGNTQMEETELNEAGHQYIPVLPADGRSLTPEPPKAKTPEFFRRHSAASAYCIQANDPFGIGENGEGNEGTCEIAYNQIKRASSSNSLRKNSGGTMSSLRFFGISPSSSPKPQRTPLKQPIVIPTVVVTAADNQLTVAHHI